MKLPESDKKNPTPCSNTTISNCWPELELGHPAPCRVSLSGLYRTESIKIQQMLLLEFEWFGVVTVKDQKQLFLFVFKESEEIIVKLIMRNHRCSQKYSEILNCGSKLKQTTSSIQ